METNNIKSKTISGFFWQLSQKVLCQVVSFGISVVLARILLPSDYGVVAICSMFLILTGIFIGGGLGTALVQKKKLTIWISVPFSIRVWSCQLSFILQCLLPHHL